MVTSVATFAACPGDKPSMVAATSLATSATAAAALAFEPRPQIGAKGEQGKRFCFVSFEGSWAAVAVPSVAVAHADPL
jgi:hypothetical protein